jgi:fatty acid desaturase
VGVVAVEVVVAVVAAAAAAAAAVGYSFVVVVVAAAVFVSLVCYEELQEYFEPDSAVEDDWELPGSKILKSYLVQG